MRLRRRTRRILGVALVLAVVGLFVWNKLLRDVPAQYESDEELFKYGSVGVELSAGVPYWIWMVLPEVFPDKLPGGYASLGAIYEPGKNMPIGLPVRRVGFPRVGLNCAVCHVGTVRLEPDAPPRIINGMPAPRFDLERYLRFLFTCATDSRFNADHLMPAITKAGQLSLVDRLLYRHLLIRFTRAKLLERKQQFAWFDTRPEQAPGRIDSFAPLKFVQLGFSTYGDDSVGNSDITSLWNMESRKNMALHWDGLNYSLDEVFINASMGLGTEPKDVGSDPLGEGQPLERMLRFTSKLKPPPYPLPIDRAKAERGRSVFQAECGRCHEAGGERVGTVIPVSEVGTDPERWLSWTKEAADEYNRSTSGFPWKFTRFRKTEGYVAPLLDGLWLRGPYLHNGSVPHLRALLSPEQRPQVFYRGYDVFDRINVGFVSSGTAAEREGFRMDVRVRGNGNQGHTYGVGRSAVEKEELLEYLKTL